MMRAYSEKYLNSATQILAEMLDYAANDCGFDCDLFMQMFIVSGIAKQFERGNLRCITGRSGVELASEIIRKVKGEKNTVTPKFRNGRTPEYWAGWALAQYQWYTAATFEDIQRSMPILDVIKLYPTLHEADITKLYNVMASAIQKESPQTNLKRIRTLAGMTQERLANDSGVSLRSIQMYEQRNKDINKAQALSIAKLARVLSCEIEDLLELETE